MITDELVEVIITAPDRDWLDELVAYVVERHPYEVPNVTALPIVGGNPDYLAWLSGETAVRKPKP